MRDRFEGKSRRYLYRPHLEQVCLTAVPAVTSRCSICGERRPTNWASTPTQVGLATTPSAKPSPRLSTIRWRTSTPSLLQLDRPPAAPGPSGPHTPCSRRRTDECRRASAPAPGSTAPSGSGGHATRTAWCPRTPTGGDSRPGPRSAPAPRHGATMVSMSPAGCLQFVLHDLAHNASRAVRHSPAGFPLLHRVRREAEVTGELDLASASRLRMARTFTSSGTCTTKPASVSPRANVRAISKARLDSLTGFSRGRSQCRDWTPRGGQRATRQRVPPATAPDRASAVRHT